MLYCETTSMRLVSLRWRRFNFAVPSPNAGALVNSQAVGGFQVNPNNDDPDLVLVTVAGHRLQAGDFLQISGFDQAGFNALVTVDSVQDANSFFVRIEGASTFGNPAGNGVVTRRIMAQSAIIRAKTGNGGAVNVGPDSLADWDALAAGAVLELEAPHGSKFDLGDWWAKSAQANTVLEILYI